ncbi:MAG: hypothetical protein A4E65_02889 [Syntrophorhabdus sp. PtaU1.Bin153]|nr:MAG: hypothetical protein A4E65_02889 [Syntrophorhabdus sp. PtaU1.Bin153]
MIDLYQWFDLYAAYGRTMLAAQMLEQTVVMIVALWRFLRRDKDERTFESIHNRLLKVPFGKVLQQGIREGSLCGETVEALENYRKLRNHLVHSLTPSITLRLCTKEEPPEVIRELNELADSFEGARIELTKDVFTLYMLTGGSQQDIIDRSSELIEKMAKLDRLEKHL